MESLPPEILQHISLYMGRKDLLNLMLTSRNLIDCARHSLYADLRVNLLSPPILLCSLSEQQHRAFAGPLRLCHPAQLVRHFTATAAALAHPTNLALLCRSLLQMSNLVSLDVSIKTYPDSMAREVFTEELCSSSTFLPNLLALKTDDIYVAMAIIPGRPVYSVCVNDSVPEALRCQFIQSLANSKSPISQLQIRLDVADNESTAATFHTIAAKFSQVTALCVEFHIVNPSERPLKWTTLKDIIHRMQPALSSLYMLHTMGMTIYPEPCRTDKEVEEVEGAVALFRQHANALRRIEFKWHMWDAAQGLRSIQSIHQSLRGQWAFREGAGT